MISSTTILKMQIVSLNIGLPQIVTRNHEAVSTAIFKQAAGRRLALRTLNLDGDRQADLSVHGGPAKAVYVYPSEHYEYWQREFPEMQLPWGMFGENFTTTGLLEPQVNVGDTFSVGTAVVMATQPRMPCYKLGIRFGRTDIIRKLLQSERTGLYLSVLQEGEVGPGDRIDLIKKSEDSVTVTEVTRLYSSDKSNVELLRKAIATEALPETWRGYFEHQLEKASPSS